jgi:hypothetical protein
MRNSRKYIVSFVLTAFVIIAWWLRIRKAGQYSLYAFDDGIHATLAKAVLEHGFPILPSGHLHFRGFLYDYALAFSCYLFGCNEFALRLPGIIAGTLIILCTYFLGKEIFARRVGLLAALVLTFSTWQIEMSRYVRFYSQFQFFFILSVYAFYQGFYKEKTIYKYIAFVCFYLALFSHCLAIYLILLFGILIVTNSRKGFLNRQNMSFFVLSVAGFLFWFYYLIPRIFTVVSEPTASSGYLHPALPLFADSIKNNTLLFSIAVFCFVLLAIFLLPGELWKKHKSIFFAYCGICALVLLQQINLALIAACLYLFLARKSPVVRTDLLRSIFIMITLGTLAWGAFGIFCWTKINGLTFFMRIYETAKALFIFSYPQLIFIYLFFKALPLMSLVVLAAVLYAARDSFLHKDKIGYTYTWLFFILVCLGMASLQDAHNEPRYVYHLFPIFVILYGFGIFSLSDALYGRFFNNKMRFLKIVLPLLLFAVTVEHANPLEAYHISQRKYGEKVNPMFAPSTKVVMMPDYKSAGEYVRARRAPDDIVILFGFAKPIFLYYIGRLDYSLEFGKDIFVEKNTPEAHKLTGCGTIDLSKLNEFIRSGRRVWLVFSLCSGNFRDESKYEDKKARFIEENRENLVFTSSDNNFLVYEFN